jgi:hypothetical protein
MAVFRKLLLPIEKTPFWKGQDKSTYQCGFLSSREILGTYTFADSIELWLRPMILPPPGHFYSFFCQLVDAPHVVKRSRPFALYDYVKTIGTY